MGMIGYLESLPEDFIMSERLHIRQEEQQNRRGMLQSRQVLPWLSSERPPQEVGKQLTSLLKETEELITIKRLSPRDESELWKKRKEA